MFHGVLVVSCSLLFSQAEPQMLESRILSVGLFKNGLALVKREVKVPGAGEFSVAAMPDPVHGTFWVQSDRAVTTRVTTREVTLPEVPLGQDLQRELAGRTVTIQYRDKDMPDVTGRVIEYVEPAAARRWDRYYRTSTPNPYDYYYNNYYSLYERERANPAHPVAPISRFLTLQTASGRSLVDTSMIASLQVDGPSKPPTIREPVLIFQVPSDTGRDKAPATIHVSYLAKGMTWLPAYRFDLAHPTLVRLQQQAVIRNELEDIADAEIFLISGYPSIEFANVDSPLSPSSTLASFFQQLTTMRSAAGLLDNMVSQQAVSYNAPAGDGLQIPATATGDDVDLHYQSIGRQTLNAGDSLMLTVAGAQGPYQRIVEWMIPDTRDEFGRAIDEWRRQQNKDQLDRDAWDAVRFVNPLPFALTTAPAMIVDGDRFSGQTTCRWANTGEQTTIRITKALSLRTGVVETEQEGERQSVRMNGTNYYRATVEGKLSLCNHRNASVTLVINRRFSGELLHADGDPKVSLREEGVYSVNPRNELGWTLELKPGEERVVTYRYRVLVAN